MGRGCPKAPSSGGAPVGDDAITRAVAALPFAGSTAGPSVVAIPSLTLVQYASLCVELAMAPEKAREILVKYLVPNKAVHAALDQHWREQLAGKPEMRAAFEKARADYAAWLREVGR
jgi:hypothetical protein